MIYSKRDVFESSGTQRLKCKEKLAYQIKKKITRMPRG